ncbi:MAG: NUDIX domain-containing protein [Candidatus Pacebacteria bacterium]|nr:NUDIX domain-containing protein [Candidatus Paceibacterota bacterium]
MERNKQYTIRARAIIMHEGALLVVKHRADTPYAVLPGGHLEWGEDPRTCVIREITEELGIVPDIGRLLFVHTFLNNDTTQTVEFHFEVLNGVAYAHPHGSEGSHVHEIAEVLWTAPHDTLPLRPDTIRTTLDDGTILADTVRFITDTAV